MLRPGAAQTGPENSVTRETLPNGLHVVIIRDPLAPVATINENYLVGGNETPTGFPGMAHAQEHMAFRGCDGLSADQIAAIYAQLGGTQDAETQQGLTQYFVTVPSQDLDVALHIDAACMAGIQDSEEQWKQERGAIEQEVARDLSNPTYKFITRLNHDLFRGTPYEFDPLGTTESFDKTTGAMLEDFYKKWYAPNNAILVISGDVDPAATLEKIKTLYGAIPRHDVPAKPAIKLQPVEAESFTLDSNLPYVLAFLAYRFPGSDSPDYAACQILGDVLASQRGNLYGLVPQGKALGAWFSTLENYRQGSIAYAGGALPANTDPAPLLAEMKQILKNYATGGVPADLVEAAKKGEVAGSEFSRNSISNLASLWSQALAGEGRPSPDVDVAAIKQVTLDDVNRVAKKYLLDQNAITAVLKPQPSGQAVSSKGFGGKEQTTAAPTKPVPLPDWAEASVKSLRVPKNTVHAADMKLANGIRLIVQTEKTSPTVTLLGSIKTQTEMQTPPGQDGVADLLEALFTYGTKTFDRLQFQKELDDIAASESAGSNFNLKVLKQDFPRGVQLLADNELNPALPARHLKLFSSKPRRKSPANWKARATKQSALSSPLSCRLKIHCSARPRPKRSVPSLTMICRNITLLATGPI